MLNLKITNGTVIDGTGSPPSRADVGIEGDRIVDVGDLSQAEARAEVDASGRYVCPGFIDVHSHSDAYLLIEPFAPSKIYQGVTTEVVGNCGASAAPLLGEYKLPSDWRQQTYPRAWTGVADYRELLEEVGPAPNVVLLIGHNTLRAGVVGYEARPATPEELTAMEQLLERSLEEGGRGLSTGLIYTPGRFAGQDEVHALAKVVARHGGIYTSHMRNESSRVLEAIDETVGVGEQAGVRVQVSHLKASGRANWPLAGRALEAIHAARERGVEVMADRYPYTAGNTELDVVLPDWALEGGAAAELARLRDPAQRARIREDLLASRDEGAWQSIMVGSTRHPDNARFTGRRLPDVGSVLGVDAVDAVLHLVDTDELTTGAFFFGLSEENMWKVLADPCVMIGSDGSIRSPEGPLGHDHPHPRAYGTYPLLLRAALDGRTVSPAEMVRKMTSLPADQFRLADRGRLAPGMAADVVVFDPATVRDTSTYADPHQLAEGIDEVLVNGVRTLAGGRPTGERAGRFLG